MQDMLLPGLLTDLNLAKSAFTTNTHFHFAA